MLEKKREKPFAPFFSSIKRNLTFAPKNIKIYREKKINRKFIFYVCKIDLKSSKC